MNADLATAVAYRPADGLRMRTNQILNDLDAELRAARIEFPVAVRRPGVDPAIVAAKSWARLAEFQLAVERAAARLVKIGAV